MSARPAASRVSAACGRADGAFTLILLDNCRSGGGDWKGPSAQRAFSVRHLDLCREIEAQFRCMGPTRPPTALVLSGGGMRGAYEVGLVSGIVEVMDPEPGSPALFDILAGTSVG